MNNNNEPTWLEKYHVLVLVPLGLIVAMCALAVQAIDVATKNGWINVSINAGAQGTPMPTWTPIFILVTSVPTVSTPTIAPSPTTRPTAIQPPTIKPVSSPTPTFPRIFLDEEHVPEGSTMSIKVDSGTIHAMTSGPICFRDTCLYGGEQRGSVVILLPSETPYLLTRLNPTYNWHGAYYGSPDQWKLVAEDRAANMKQPGQCNAGKACTVIDILAIDANGIFAQYTR